VVLDDGILMKLPALPVQDPRATMNFDAIVKHDLSLVQIAAAAGASPIKVAYGTGTWTWPGGQESSSITTITHGLGTTPAIVIAQANADQGATEALVSVTFSPTSTTFGTRGSSKVHTNYPAATTATFYWLAIG
jgi:hypothetical protein